MSGGGGNSRSSSGSRNRKPTTPTTPAPNPYANMPGYSSNSSLNPSWAGGSTAKTFEPKDFATGLLGDAQKIFKQGPKVFNQALYNEYSPETMGLIQQGLGDVNMVRNSPMGGVAAGNWLSGGNPYLNQMIAQTRDNISTDTNAAFNSMGMYGSDAHAKGLSEGLGSAELQARYGNFQDEWSRMAQAQGLMSGATAQGMGYSEMLDSKAREKLLAQKDLFDRQNNASFEHVAKNWGMLTGGGSTQGAEASTNQEGGMWDWLGAIGSVAGAVLPAVLPMLSDERAKTDIKQVGKTDAGAPVYTYRYKSGGPVQMGVMAQDMLKQQPDVVTNHPTGLLAVDYRKVR